MRLISTAALLISLLATASGALAQDSAVLFRYASFAPEWTVTLDEPVDVPTAFLERGLVTRDPQGIYRFRFSQQYDHGAVPIEITIRTTPDDLVASLRFDYGSTYRFANERASYIERLGPPTRTQETASGEAAIWENENTLFKLVQTRSDGGARTYSILSSR